MESKEEKASEDHGVIRQKTASTDSVDDSGSYSDSESQNL